MSQEKLDHVAMGILISFGGFLTSREEKLTLSASNDAAPIIPLIKEFAELHGIADCDALPQWESRMSGGKE